jgi:hypothetical protein
MRLVTAASRCRSSVRRSTSRVVRHAGQQTHRNGGGLRAGADRRHEQQGHSPGTRKGRKVENYVMPRRNREPFWIW